MFTGFKEEEC